MSTVQVENLVDGTSAADVEVRIPLVFVCHLLTRYSSLSHRLSSNAVDRSSNRTTTVPKLQTTSRCALNSNLPRMHDARLQNTMGRAQTDMRWLFHSREARAPLSAGASLVGESVEMPMGEEEGSIGS